MLRADVDGKIYVARVESGTSTSSIRRAAPSSATVPLTGKRPDQYRLSGATDGKTVFVTQAKGGYVECQGRVRSGGSRHAAPPASWPALGRPSAPLPVQTPAAARAGGSLTLDGMKGSWVYIMSNRRNGVLYVGVTCELSRIGRGSTARA